MKIRDKDMFTEDRSLFFTLFCGGVGFFLVFGAAWGGRIVALNMVVTLVSLSGLLLCRKIASKFPKRWFLWGIFYVLPFIGFALTVPSGEIKAAHFWRTVSVIVTLSAVAGSYWGKYTGGRGC